MELAGALRFSFDSTQSTSIPFGFVARLLVLYLIFVKGLEQLPPPFLSFIPGLDFFREVPVYTQLLNIVYWSSMFAILINFRIRTFALILGSVIFLEIVSNRLQFSNSLLFCGCFLFLIGMFRPGLAWIFKVQLSLLYLGAGINKLLEEDWRSGRYFDFFFREAFENKLYIELSNLSPEFSLAIFLSYSTILIELILGIMVLVLKRNFWLVFTINLFHLSMLILTAGELSIHFFSLMAFCSLLILPWETTQLTIEYNGRNKMLNLLIFLDFKKFFYWENSDQKKVAVKENGIIVPILFSYFKVLIYHRVVFSIFVWTITLTCLYKNHLLQLICFYD
jgi:hypothetical protein